MRIGRIPLSILIWGLAAILVLAGLLYIDLTRETAAATVLSKREQIRADFTGTSWIRRTEALVRYQVDFRTYQRWIRLDTGTYDLASRGSTVDVSYVTINPEWARQESRSIFSTPFQDIRPWQGVTWLVLAGGLVALVLLHREWGVRRWWMLRRSPAARVGLLLAVLAWLSIVVSGYVLPPSPRISSSPRDARAEAQIRDVTTVSHFGGGDGDSGSGLPIRLPQGFHRVELSFTPEGSPGPVVAVDEIDEGSATGLTAGVDVPIQYAPDDPRDARMTTGTRDHRWTNFLVIQGVVLGMSGLALSAPLVLRWVRG